MIQPTFSIESNSCGENVPDFNGMHGRFSMHRRDCVLQSRAVKSAKEPHHSSGDDVIVRFDCGVSGLGSIKPPQHLKSHRLGSGSSTRFSRNSIKPTVRVVDPASASTDTSGVIGFRTGLDSVLIMSLI